MTGQTTNFALRIGPLGPPHLFVHGFTGIEALNRAYDFRIQISTLLPAPVFERFVLGAEATFYARAAGHDRQFHGIIAAVRSEARHAAEAPHHSHFTVRLVPRLWLLTRRKDSRIFQDKRFDEIIEAVLHDRRIEANGFIYNVRPKRPSSTQFEESDAAFVRRLCAENAIAFYFEHPAAIVDTGVDIALQGLALLNDPNVAPIGDVLTFLQPAGVAIERPTEEIVFTDHAAYPAIDGSMLENVATSAGDFLTKGQFGHHMPAPGIPYMPAGALSTSEDYILEFRAGRAVRTNKATYREYDPERPLSPLIATRDASAAPTAADADEIFRDAMGGDVLSALSNLETGPTIAGLERYDHDGRDLFPSWTYGNEEPSRALLQHRRNARLCSGRSSSVRLSAGRRFTLEGHPHLAVDGAYVVTSIRHEGLARPTGANHTGYTNSFECVPARVTYVPPRPARRSVQVCLTATVAGPPGEEIYVNERGEIKVKFHWDRSEERGDPTCWLRTMQPWAGIGWGFQFIPRVGMEVIVVFEGGDPDKPIVTGSVYNRIHPMPFPTPEDKTRSGIRTRSSPASEGKNELSFQDRTGHEQIYLHAERDWDSRIRHDRTTEIGRDDHLRVAGTRTTRVERDVSSEVHGSEQTEVRGDRIHRVDGTEQVRRQDVDVLIQKSRSTLVLEKESLETRGQRHALIHGDDVTEVRGATTLFVGTMDEPRAATARVEGPSSLSAADIIDISSEKEIVLRVGCSYIRMSAGDVEIGSPKVTIRGKDSRVLLDEGEIRSKAKKSFQVVSDKSIALKAKVASIGLETQASVDGTEVLLNSRTQATDVITSSEPEPTRIELVDKAGRPLAYQRFRIDMEDGTRVVGFVDENGQAEVDVEGAGTIVFEELVDVEEA